MIIFQLNLSLPYILNVFKFHAAIMSDSDHLKVEQKEKTLIEGASEGHEECVEYLIEAGVDVNINPAEVSDHKQRLSLRLL